MLLRLQVFSQFYYLSLVYFTTHLKTSTVFRFLVFLCFLFCYFKKGWNFVVLFQIFTSFLILILFLLVILWTLEVFVSLCDFLSFCWYFYSILRILIVLWIFCYCFLFYFHLVVLLLEFFCFFIIFACFLQIPNCECNDFTILRLIILVFVSSLHIEHSICFLSCICRAFFL